ncbi:MAG TPA: phosphoribosylglycinamide formyltransferase [Anaerohalosphaeraceae bacterium]|nr:phosphoribosylglycinamide formyltransferase [Anaerohalosphaeraceae bacterium]HRT51227.1 phosphoribosylglycinamide formyltransferase [Anaerohalosphaeraceae bacterium]HRT87418.1 phosphoribosylglycinamide formyltransferase [Anaerohalosphaeraceae bacterium]
MHDNVIIHTDGGSRGNPGPAAAAYIISDAHGHRIAGKGLYLGKTTNNVAEYTGLVRGLAAARDLGVKAVTIYTDSELMTRQISGAYKVKSEHLKPLFAECMQLLSGFRKWRVQHVPREKNAQADKLANQAMDARADVELAAAGPSSAARPPARPRSREPLRLGILLSGGGRTMVNIQKEIEAGRLNAKIVVVISSRSDVQGVQRTREMGLEPAIIRRKDYPDIDAFSNRIREVLDAARVDLVVQAGWLCLWRIPREYENRVMNIHPALLPAFGGKGMWGHHVHEAVLAAGCKVSGCTVHFCTNEYDKGPIIVQRCCEVKPDDDADTLAARVFEQECIAYPEAIRLFAENRIVVAGGIARIRPADRQVTP